MVVSFSYWELYEECMHAEFDARHKGRGQDQVWRIYKAESFGPDMFLVSCTKPTGVITEAMAEAGGRYLGAASFTKDKKTGEDKPTEWHWLVAI
jgi:hypothetical protein